MLSHSWYVTHLTRAYLSTQYYTKDPCMSSCTKCIQLYALHNSHSVRICTLLPFLNPAMWTDFQSSCLYLIVLSVPFLVMVEGTASSHTVHAQPWFLAGDQRLRSTDVKSDPDQDAKLYRIWGASHFLALNISLGTLVQLSLFHFLSLQGLGWITSCKSPAKHYDRFLNPTCMVNSQSISHA